jgi:hypothetical protein
VETKNFACVGVTLMLARGRCYIDVDKRECCKERIIKRRRKSRTSMSKAWKLKASKSVSFHTM